MTPTLVFGVLAASFFFVFVLGSIVDSEIIGLAGACGFVIFIILFTAFATTGVPRYDVICGENTYTEAETYVDGNYLKITENDVEYYEDEPCEWTILK